MASETLDDTPSSTATPVEASVPAVAPTTERTRQKRPRAAVDPGTPKGDGDGGKGPSSMTPLAKKGRVEEGEEGASDNERSATPPPAGEASNSRPSTPSQDVSPSKPPATEGKDTKKLRERVAAMKPPGQTGETEEGSTQDVEIAEVADEVSASAAKLGDEQEAKETKDVEIAEVAAEVGKSAEQLAQQDERKEQDDMEGIGKGESKEVADTAAEVAESAATVQAKDEKIADAASEVAESAKEVPEPTPAPTPKTNTSGQPSFSSYSSTASPFAAFASTSSPLASVPAPAKPSAEQQKPKTKSTFSAAPFAASSIPPAVPPASTTDKPASTEPAATASASTPFTKAAPTTNLAAASPFSAFASTSGFAAAGKSGASSAFSAFSATPSAFTAVPSADSGATTSSASPAPADAEEKRIYTEQEVVTGEEEEETVHSVRCKLFAMHEGNWVERGTGPFKVNQTKKEGKHNARLVMRADATHRLLLNAPLFREFVIDVSNEKYVRFTVITGDGPTSYMLRTANATAAQNLVQAVRDKAATL
ncbi:hypothetical protein JCM10296v2_000542 [Rhodotorula toruloides]